ncbi:hypothetical protein [Streptomyces sp. NPDC016845]|uniref:hypothetical protein n=1 Tax=Streptomyces sp. NPDC016845 TaxID=3364972 RepID=UPI003792FA95
MESATGTHDWGQLEEVRIRTQSRAYHDVGQPHAVRRQWAKLSLLANPVRRRLSA